MTELLLYDTEVGSVEQAGGEEVPQEFLDGTGGRIGEALGVREVAGLEAGVVERCRRRAVVWPNEARPIAVITSAGETGGRTAGEVGLLFPCLFGAVRNH